MAPASRPQARDLERATGARRPPPVHPGAAASLGIARATVVEAFDTLAAEGCIDRRRGSGSYVSQQVTNLRAPTQPGQARGNDPHRLPALRARQALGSLAPPRSNGQSRALTG